MLFLRRRPVGTSQPLRTGSFDLITGEQRRGNRAEFVEKKKKKKKEGGIPTNCIGNPARVTKLRDGRLHSHESLMGVPR